MREKGKHGEGKRERERDDNICLVIHAVKDEGKCYKMFQKHPVDGFPHTFVPDEGIMILYASQYCTY